jgi:cytochrome c556
MARGTGDAMLTPTVEEIVTYAKKLVDHWPDSTLGDIVRGKYPADLCTFSRKRIEVYQRACLIVLDARSEAYPETAESWSKDELEKRILGIKNQDNRYGKDTRAIAQSRYIDGDKLDDRWG